VYLQHLSVEYWPILSADISTDSRLTYRPIRGGVSVDCQWYRCIVNRCFAEIAAVFLPTGDVKEESIIYAHMLIGEDAAQTAIISNTCQMQLEVSTTIAGKKQSMS